MQTLDDILHSNARLKPKEYIELPTLHEQVGMNGKLSEPTQAGRWVCTAYTR